MKKLILLAAAGLVASAGPAIAKPGKGHGKGQGHHSAHVGHGSPVGYGVGGCPPGLQKKGCMPPGQANKLFGVGQRVPQGYRGLLGYESLPDDLRRHYGRQLDPRSRYIYDNSYVYRVEPRTMLVQQILGAVLRPY